MNKKTAFLFLLIALLVFSHTHAQTNPFYKVTQENVRPMTNSNFEVTGIIQEGNPFNLIYPAYTSFLTDGYVLENIPSSKHIQGIPIGFKFPYAGEEFDIYAVNVKGYIVLGKSWEGGMTVYADTLIETATDTIFTTKNKYLISGLYLGKNLDFQGQVSISIHKGGFEGERKLYISLLGINSSGGNQMFITTNFELKETGEININPYVQYQSFNTNNPIINTYASIMQRYGTDKTYYIHGTGIRSDAWFHTAQFYANTDYKYGIIRDTIIPASVNQKLYNINYQPKVSNFKCPLPMRWDPNLSSYKDSAYTANDYEELQRDTLSTTDQVWWYSDMRDSLSFDVYLGTDEIGMEKIKTRLVADTINNRLNYIIGLVSLPLDSLSANEKYFMKIHTIYPSGDTTVCEGYYFYTKPKEEIKNYCRSGEPSGGGGGAFTLANLDLNTLHFHPDSLDILSTLEYKTIVPDTGSWTIHLQQGQTYQLQLSTASWSDLHANNYLASVFIDSNNDGIFDGLDGHNNYTYGINDTLYNPFLLYIPQNAVPGKTRIRVAVRAYCNTCHFPGACDTGDEDLYGTPIYFADFIVTIEQSPNCSLSYRDTIVSPSCSLYSNGSLGIIPEEGTAPYHIQWNTGNPKDTLFTLSDLASPVRHRATVTDAAGCSIRTNMLQIRQPLPLQIDTFFQSVQKFIVFSGGTKPYRAVITGDKTETRYAVNDTIILTDLFIAGNYTVQATDSNGCDMQEYSIHKAVLDIDKNTFKTAFILYPNPAGKHIQISGIDNIAFITIYNIDGKKVFEGKTVNQQMLFLPDVAAGLYFVQIEAAEGRATLKLIIN